MKFFKNLTLTKRIALIISMAVFIPLISGSYFALKAAKKNALRITQISMESLADIEAREIKSEINRLRSELNLLATSEKLQNLILLREKRINLNLANFHKLLKETNLIDDLKNQFKSALLNNPNLWAIAISTLKNNKIEIYLSAEQNRKTNKIEFKEEVTLKEETSLKYKQYFEAPEGTISFFSPSLLFPSDPKDRHILDSILFYSGRSEKTKDPFVLTFFYNPFLHIEKFHLNQFISREKSFNVILRELKDGSIKNFTDFAENTNEISMFLKLLPKDFLSKDEGSIINNDHSSLIIRKIPLRIENAEKLVILSFYKGTKFKLFFERNFTLALMWLGFVLILTIPISFLGAKVLTRSLVEITKELEKTSLTLEKSTLGFKNTSKKISETDQKNSTSIKEIFEKIAGGTSQNETIINKNNEMKALSKYTSKSAIEARNDLNELTISMERIIESSKNISKIIGIIENISIQTNILSMNASVEAARAGEHGKGFAVVAEAIRALAQKSSQSASEIGKLVRNSIEISELGANSAAKNQSKFQSITQNIEKLDNLVDFSSEMTMKRSEVLKQLENQLKIVLSEITLNSSEIKNNEEIVRELEKETHSLNNTIDSILILVQSKKN